MEGNVANSVVSARLIGDCEVSLWGLTAFERLRRQLAAVGVSDVDRYGRVPIRGSTALLLRSDWLYDQRTIADLLNNSSVIVRRDRLPVAAHVSAELVDAAAACLQEPLAPVPDGVEETTVENLSTAYNDKLLKAQPPYALPVRRDNRVALERHLFDESYKGITDVVTKWVWPAPARAVVRLFSRYGVSPNAVTISSVVLVVAATWLFWLGHFGLGLALGWLMTFFDTVDGKLARVTVSAGRFGHALDKGTDLIHPPIWYVAWGHGLQVGGESLFDTLPAATGGLSGTPLWDAYLVILAGYILGRLIEGAFELLGDFVIYSWRPTDSWVRLIIARRNPNLVLLTAGWLAGRPDVGLYAVAVWTAVSTVFLAARLLQAGHHRLTRGPLESWLKSVTPDDPRLSARVFARRELPVGLRS